MFSTSHYPHLKNQITLRASDIVYLLILKSDAGQPAVLRNTASYKSASTVYIVKNAVFFFIVAGPDPEYLF